MYNFCPSWVGDFLVLQYYISGESASRFILQLNSMWMWLFDSRPQYTTYKHRYHAQKILYHKWSHHVCFNTQIMFFYVEQAVEPVVVVTLETLKLTWFFHFITPWIWLWDSTCLTWGSSTQEIVSFCVGKQCQELQGIEHCLSRKLATDRTTILLSITCRAGVIDRKLYHSNWLSRYKLR